VYPYSFCAAKTATLPDLLKWKDQYTDFEGLKWEKRERDRYLGFAYWAKRFLDWEGVEKVKRRVIVGYEEDKRVSRDSAVVGVYRGSGIDVLQWQVGMMGIQVEIINREAVR
jgi:hypothetical protein